MSSFQLRRRLLSLLEVIYSVQRHRPREAFVEVRGSLAVLLSQADIDLSWSPFAAGHRRVFDC